MRGARSNGARVMGGDGGFHWGDGARAVSFERQELLGDGGVGSMWVGWSGDDAGDGAGGLGGEGFGGDVDGDGG